MSEITHLDLFYPLYVPIFVWLVGLIILLIILLRKYTFGDWTPEKPNPYVAETLGMPTGIFRGLITLTLLYCVVVFEVNNFVTKQTSERIFSEFMVSFQMMIAFYFGSKVVSQLSSSEEKKTEVKANAAATIQGFVSNSQTSNSSSFASSTMPTTVAASAATPAAASNVSTEAQKVKVTSDEEAQG